jgi:dihydrolipoamide dehydrogenase
MQRVSKGLALWQGVQRDGVPLPLLCLLSLKVKGFGFMGQREFDVVVIGAGPGGYVAAIRAAQLGMKVACVDKGKDLGGTCLNIGCIPSKTLLHATELYESVLKEGKEMGLEASGLSVDFGGMMVRKGKVVKSLTDGVAGLFKKNKVERVEGNAKFVDPYAIEVTSEGKTRRIEADHFILATGSDSVELPFLKFDEKRIVSSTGALSLEKVPKRMIVIGAGVIGVELGSVYRRLGSEVQFIEMLDEICVMMDPTIRKSLLRILKQQGMEFHLSATVKSGKVEGEGVTIEFEEGGEKKSLQGDVVLVAVGRRPYSDGLGLDSIGIEKSKKGFVSVDGSFRTSQKHIFAIGDIIEGPMLAHKASDEGTAAVEIIAGKQARVNYLAIPNVIYTHPEAASVGMTEPEAKEAGLDLMVGTAFFKGNARARCMAYTEGLVKIIGDKKSGRLVGVHILGAHASEMIGEGVIAIDKKTTVEEIAQASHAHPTLSESIKEAAMDALGYAMH